MPWNLIFADGMIYGQSMVTMSHFKMRWGISLPCKAMAQSQVIRIYCMIFLIGKPSKIQAFDMIFHRGKPCQNIQFYDDFTLRKTLRKCNIFIRIFHQFDQDFGVVSYCGNSYKIQWKSLFSCRTFSSFSSLGNSYKILENPQKNIPFCSDLPHQKIVIELVNLT